jgi:hypothetical protein
MLENMKEIRDYIYARMDWSPNESDEAKSRIQRMLKVETVNQAARIQDLFVAPVRMFIEPPEVPTLATDLIDVVTNDAWVLEQTITKLAGAMAFASDRTYANRIIEVQVSDGSWRQHRIRHVDNNNAGGKARIYLVDPWPNATPASGFKYRIVSTEFVLPSKVTKVISAQCRANSTASSGQTSTQPSPPFPLKIHPHHTIQKLGFFWDSYNNSGAQPTSLFPIRNAVSIRNPVTAPVCSASNLNWAGPEPRGSFEYYITYCWGLRHTQERTYDPTTSSVHTSEEYRGTPLFESNPSPASDVIASGATAITVTLPNPSFMQGFGDVAGATPRETKSGWYIRIYRKRTAIEASPGQRVEVIDKAYLIHEVPGHTTSWNDDGSLTPSINTPLVKHRTYKTFMVYPPPQRVYELDLTCAVEPPPWEDDYETHGLPHEVALYLALCVLAHLKASQGETLGLQLKEEIETAERNARRAAESGGVSPVVYRGAMGVRTIFNARPV